jgi:curved DNA-binding protein CbpA
LAKRLHPDVANSGDRHKFSQLVQAFEALRDPQSRAAYDAEYAKFKLQNSELVSGAARVDSDSVDRRSLLSLFYAQRRRDMDNPGIGVGTLEHVMNCPREVLGFHIWYFREKGWIKREESGQLAITAEGVDQIELTGQRIAQTHERLIEAVPGSGHRNGNSHELNPVTRN